MSGPPMARSSPKPAPRLPVGAHDATQPGGVELRLAIGREGVGLELANPAVVGCLRVVTLRTTLPGLRFPADVSGGVTRFRHKRAELQHLRVELGARGIEQWAPPRLRGLVSEGAPTVWLRVHAHRATVCVYDEQEVTRLDTVTPALAFELHVLAEEDIVVVVSSARGVNLAATPTALAVACIETLLGRYARRAGAEFTVPTPATALLRALLPEAGARAASVRGVRWKVDSDKEEIWTLLAEREGALGTPTVAALRAQEVARILSRGDDMLVAGDPNRARGAYMKALERAPRHPEIVMRIADIDARVLGREEAVLGLMAESAEQSGFCSFGVTRSELLARIGRTRRAAESFEQAVSAEPAPLFAARLCELAAANSDDPNDKENWLDRALATNPRASAARWSRAVNRLRLGRTSDALGDVQHLDASSHRDRDRYDIWTRAGKAWQAAGFHTDATSLFERALLHVPDEPEALAGLGAALVETGATARGTSLLARAFDLAVESHRPVGAILLVLGRALADRMGDLPAGIARVSAIPRDAPEAIVARGHEGQWRSRLGDLVGASLAFSTVRDMASSLVAAKLQGAPDASSLDDRTGEVVELLLEAAEFERTRRHDELAAEAHLAEARRLQPSLVESVRGVRFAQETEAPLAGVPAGFRLNLDPNPQAPSGSPEVALRVEELTRRFQANPDDLDVANELSGLLESLGRSHELLALLSARLDDAAPEERAELVPRVRATLERLAVGAESGGRLGEASLYRSALEALGQ
jgi:tetratricopeptide (TPR) repeat protein